MFSYILTFIAGAVFGAVGLLLFGLLLAAREGQWS